MTNTTQPAVAISQRTVALTAGFALLVMAVLAPFAYFGVLKTLVVPADATATVNNIVASDGFFRAGIAAFLIVIILDIVVAWALYVLLKPVNRDLSMLVAWLRVAFAAVFAYALANLLDVAQLLGNTAYLVTLPREQLDVLVMSSVASFGNGWDIALALFGLHLVGLGVLLFRSTFCPRVLGVLVVIAGGGYLFETFGKILVPDYSLSVSIVTFVGEALLIVWLFWTAIKGSPSTSEDPDGQVADLRPAHPASVAS